jgi:hypothetical protein
MSPFRLDAGILLGIVLLSSGLDANAQQVSQRATIAVSLRVLPLASFEADTAPRFSTALAPGEPLRVEPAAGVRLRMRYDAATKVVVSGTPLIGPGGATVRVRYVCAFGGGTTVSAAEPFDCVGGLLAGLDGRGTTTIPLAIGAQLSALETVDLLPGLYTGRVTLTATHGGY